MENLSLHTFVVLPTYKTYCISNTFLHFRARVSEYRNCPRRFSRKKTLAEDMNVTKQELVTDISSAARVIAASGRKVSWRTQRV